MLTHAAICPAPPLLARELTGIDPAVPQLRDACLDATSALLAGRPDLVAVVGAAAQTASFDPAGRLDLTVFAPGLRRPGGAGPGRTAGPAGDGRLPVPLGLGGLLLDQAGYAGGRELQAIAEQAPVQECAALGARLAGAAERVALLVMADGSARRTRKAPGYLDERSVPFDAEVERIIAAGELAGLLTLDAGLAAEVMMTGRAALQVLAGAAGPRRLASQVRYNDDPFGVAYLVASLAGN